MSETRPDNESGKQRAVETEKGLKSETSSRNAGKDRAPKGVPAVRRAAAILWLLAERTTPLTLSQIARGVDILPSTALQILREMAAARLIAVDSAQKVYTLGQGLIDLGQFASQSNQFAELSRPYLHDIAMQFNVTATATAVIDNRHSACVVSITPPGSLSLNVTLGGRVPILSGAVGRCIGAYSRMPAAQLQRNFERIRWQRPLSFEEWKAQVDAVRQSGYAEDEGLFAPGVTTLAAPVFGPDGSVSRAVGIATISAALNQDQKADLAAALVTAAEHITRELAV